MNLGASRQEYEDVSGGTGGQHALQRASHLILDRRASLATFRREIQR